MNVHCLSGAIVTVSTNMITWTMKGGDWGRGRSNVKKQEEKMGFAIQISFLIFHPSRTQCEKAWSHAVLYITEWRNKYKSSKNNER